MRGWLASVFGWHRTCAAQTQWSLRSKDGRPFFRAPAIGMKICLFAGATLTGTLDLLHDLAQVVAFWCLKRRELSIRFEVLQPHLLTNGQKIEIVLERGHRCSYRTADYHGALHINTNGLLEGISLDVLDQGHVKLSKWQDPPFWSRLRRGVVSLPVLVAHRRRRCAREVEEEIARRLLRFAFEIVTLIDAVERRLDDAGILAGLDLLLEVLTLRAAGDVDERGYPIERCEELVLDSARLDVAGPADHQRCAVAAFPRLALLALERRDATIRAGNCFGPVVGGEDDAGVVQLSHGLDFLEDITDVVVHLLHASLVGAPILAAALAEHGFVFRRQYRCNVHARRVVPNEEGLVGLLGIVAVEEVDDLGGDLLIHRLRSLKRQGTLVTASLVLFRAVDRKSVVRE